MSTQKKPLTEEERREIHVWAKGMKDKLIALVESLRGTKEGDE